MNRFKALGFVAVCAAGLFTFANAARAASPAEADRFVGEVKKATQKKDLQGLLALVCWDGVDAKTRKMVEGHLKDVVKTPVKEVGLEDYADFPFKANLKVVKRLRFVVSENESSFIPVGEKAGKLMIAVTME